MGKKFDYLYIKNKVRNYALEQAKETIALLYTEEGIIQGPEQTAIDKALKKQIKYDLGPGVKAGVKFVKAQRKKLIKSGEINPKQEALQFMYEIGILTPPEPEEGPSGQEDVEGSETVQEAESEAADKPETEPKTDETTAAEEPSKKPKRVRQKAKKQPESSDQGAGTPLSANLADKDCENRN